MGTQNDDIANSYSLEDLLILHKDIRCPLVFDFHHHKCAAPHLVLCRAGNPCFWWHNDIVSLC